MHTWRVRSTCWPHWLYRTADSLLANTAACVGSPTPETWVPAPRNCRSTPSTLTVAATSDFTIYSDRPSGRSGWSGREQGGSIQCHQTMTDATGTGLIARRPRFRSIRASSESHCGHRVA